MAKRSKKADKSAERIFDALTGGEYDNFSLADGEIGGIPCSFVVADGEDEDGEDDKPVALILTKDVLAALEDADFAAEAEDEKDSDEEDEERDDDKKPAKKGKRFRA